MMNLGDEVRAVLPVDWKTVRLVQNDLRSNVVRSSTEGASFAATRQTLLAHPEVRWRWTHDERSGESKKSAHATSYLS